ncbi:MAG TPA: hypothetical protein PLJ21_13510, partial [Pseudobdellovibrionaceae bacterium]|nr:hypothetical protein [Pseudobdellovibrionaceae bacterium]
EKRKNLRSHQPVLKQIPPSLPNHEPTVATKIKSEILFKLGEQKKITQQIDLEFFVHQGRFTSEGLILEFPRGSKTGSEYDYVFVNVTDPSIKKYYIIKPKDFILNPKGKKLNGVPQLIEIQGEIEIQDLVNEKKGVYRALITKAQFPIDLNSLLVRGELPKFDSTDPGDSNSNIHAQIVGGQYEGKRILMSNNSLVFLNAGLAEGVEVGQGLNVYSNILSRNKNSLEVQNHKRIALLKVVHVAQNYSTAYVLDNKEEIMFGDIVGTPNDQPLDIDKISPLVGEGFFKKSSSEVDSEADSEVETTDESDVDSDDDSDADSDTADADSADSESEEESEDEDSGDEIASAKSSNSSEEAGVDSEDESDEESSSDDEIEL